MGVNILHFFFALCLILNTDGHLFIENIFIECFYIPSQVFGTDYVVVDKTVVFSPFKIFTVH